MSASTDIRSEDLPPDDDLLAAEYVLGTLDATEYAAIAARLGRERDLRRAVAAWSERLSPMAETVEPVEPPSSVFDAIEARLDGRAPATSRDAAQASPKAAAPADPRAEPPAGVVSLDEVRRLRRSLLGWRVTAGAMGALAAAVAAVAVLAPGLITRPSPPEAQYIAVVDRGGELPALIVQVDVAAGLVRVRAPAAEAPPERALELWFVAGDAAPRSLGLVHDAAYIRLAPDLVSTAPGATLAVSVEPEGGSPTGAPTGPVVYSGVLIPQ